jgi:hypothetical protein
MKILKKDYPFLFLVEDKIGQTSGKLYQSISLGLISVKDKTATNPKDKYKTDFIKFFDEKDLLKLAHLCTSTYDKIKTEREIEKQGEKLSKGMTKPILEEKPITDDDVLF